MTPAPSMRAMVLDEPGQVLRHAILPIPSPGADEVLLRVEACGVCRTDLHLVDGELPDPTRPIIPGHEIVGRVVAVGAKVSGIPVGQRLGVPWLGRTCGSCRFCTTGQENLCDDARFTGYQLNGGFAEYTVADQRYCFPLPERADAAALAPLLCAGLIGYRALRMAGDALRVGVYGFGAAAHVIAQVLRYQGREFYAFTRHDDVESRAFAMELGASWAGSSDQPPPQELDAALLFAPVGQLVPTSLKHVRKGGVVVCAGIHMSDIPTFPYRILWGERVVRSVANLTRRDGDEFLSLATRVPVLTTVQTFALSQANEALNRLRHGRVQGAAVLVPQ